MPRRAQASVLARVKDSDRDQAHAILARGAVRDFEAKESTIYYTGPTGSKSVTYRDPETGETYTDYTKPIGPAQSKLPDYIPGIAFGYRNFPKHGRETLGGYYLVTPKEGENAGRSFILPHSDIGPGAGKGEKLDYNAPAAKMVYGSMKESNIRGGSYLHYIGKDLPPDIGIGPLPKGLESRFDLSESHAGFIREQREGEAAARPSFLPENQIVVRRFRLGEEPKKIPGVTIRGTDEIAPRALAGRELDAAAPTVNANGKLDVDVSAPKDVSVKAEGEGLFNKTEMTRQVEPMEAEQ